MITLSAISSEEKRFKQTQRREEEARSHTLNLKNRRAVRIQDQGKPHFLFPSSLLGRKKRQEMGKKEGGVLYEEDLWTNVSLSSIF